MLLRAELGELGRELLARELGGVGDELVELLAQRGGVADGGGDALEVRAVGLDLAVLLAAARPPGHREDDHEEDRGEDEDALDAGAAAVWTATRLLRRRGLVASGRLAGRVVVEEIHSATPVRQAVGGRGGT